MDFKSHLETNFSKEISEEIFLTLTKERTYGVLVNTKKISLHTFAELFPNLEKHPFVKNGFIYNQNKVDLNRHYLHDLGAYYLQDPSAMSTISFLNVLEGDFILDLCAAPGGKTIQTSLLLGESGLLVANDLSFARSKKLLHNVERLGLGNVIITNNDFQKLDPNFSLQFDKIIIDAPCSSSMMFRKNIKAKEDWSFKKVLSLQKKQKELILLAYRLLKRGGELIYATCSFSKEENEDVVQHLLKNTNGQIIKLPQNPLLYESKHLLGSYYLLPHLFPGEGQFICKVKKPGRHELTKYEKHTYRGPYLKEIDKFNLMKRYNFFHLENMYSLPFKFTNKYLNILRSGVKSFTLKGKVLVPHYHLSQFLLSKKRIHLTKEEMEKYYLGHQLFKKVSNGYHLVSYQDINLGYVKAQNGTLKNLLPKYIRKQF